MLLFCLSKSVEDELEQSPSHLFFRAPKIWNFAVILRMWRSTLLVFLALCVSDDSSKQALDTNKVLRFYWLPSLKLLNVIDTYIVDGVLY